MRPATGEPYLLHRHARNTLLKDMPPSFDVSSRPSQGIVGDCRPTPSPPPAHTRGRGRVVSLACPLPHPLSHALAHVCMRACAGSLAHPVRAPPPPAAPARRATRRRGAQPCPPRPGCRQPGQAARLTRRGPRAHYRADWRTRCCVQRGCSWGGGSARRARLHTTQEHDRPSARLSNLPQCSA